MPAYWFKPKRYGYGATPVTWQGWAIVGVSVILVMAAAFFILDHDANSLTAWAAFWIIAVVITAALCAIGRRKTEGGWRWRWGGQ